MSDNLITRDVYKQYARKIVSVLQNEEFYEQYKKRVDKGSSSFKLAKKRLIQDISIDWIDTIEEILPNLDTIVRNPRKFIVQEEDIVDVSLARSISTESVKFLAQHTNMISKVDKDGMVTPSKILNITKEESFEIYENRFIYTLLLKLKDFVTMRYDKIKKASATQDVLELDVESRFSLPSKKVTFRTEYFAQLSFDEVMRLDPDTLSKIERVAKIDRIITDFLSSSFAKSMRNSAPVRPPIMRTNVILKEPNFKKALTLWQFIETYNVTGGFSTSDEVEDYDLEQESVDELKKMVTLNTMLFESMYDQHETDLDMEDKEFADFMRVGEMDFEKDKLDRDEYAQKPDDKVENEEEEDNIEETHRPESEEPLPDELPDEEQEKEKVPEKEPDITPDGQDKSAKEIVQEVEVEKLVEVEIIKELPPKADQEEVDLDADADKFDQHLFEVRKLYKKPADDKLTAEDIAKVKDAIDRCLNSYRRIKQEELDQKERDYRIRRRKEDMAKRAAAFNKLREELEKTVTASDRSKLKFGLDPFEYQRAKIATERREAEIIEERKKRLAEIEEANRLAKEQAEQQAIEEAQAAQEEQAATAENEATDINEEAVENNGAVDEVNSEAVENNKPEDESVAEEPAEEQAKPADGVEESAVEQEKPAEPKPAKKPRRKKDIEIVDEHKVSVGSIHFAEGSELPYDAMFVKKINKSKPSTTLKSKAEKHHAAADKPVDRGATKADKTPEQQADATAPKKQRAKTVKSPAEGSATPKKQNNKTAQQAEEPAENTAKPNDEKPDSDGGESAE